MKRSIKAAGFLIGLLLVLCASVQANTLALGDQAYYDAAPELRWLDGGGRELTPEQALGRLRDGQGQRLSDSYPTLGFRQGDQWLPLPLANRSGLDLWYLRAARPHLHKFVKATAVSISVLPPQIPYSCNYSVSG